MSACAPSSRHLKWTRKIHTYEKQGLDVTAQKIQEFARNERIPFSHILVDEDGVGGGVVDTLRGIKGFTANAKAFENQTTHQTQNFANLKAQCTYMLADYVNAHKIAVRADLSVKTALVEELEQIKTKDIDKDRKLQIRPKDEIKEVLGRSPDYADALMMRMYFELKPSMGQFAVQYKPSFGKPTITTQVRAPQYRPSFNKNAIITERTGNKPFQL